MKKEITIVLFDLDNTLYKHDTEGQWLQHLTDLGVLDKKENNRKIKYFDEEYVKGRLKIDKYFENSKFLEISKILPKSCSYI